MGKYTQAAGRGAFCGAAVIGMGFLAEGCIDLSYGQTQADVVGDMESYAVDTEEGLIAKSTFEAQIGEACLGFISTYRQDGVLAYTTEAEFLDDAAVEPGLPCGSQAEARTALAKLRGVDSDLREAENGLTRSKEQLESGSYDPEPMTFAEAATTTLGFAALGGVIGAAVQFIANRRKRSDKVNPGLNPDRSSGEVEASISRETL